MKIVNEHLASVAHLVTPNDNGYLLLAADLGGWLARSRRAPTAPYWTAWPRARRG